MLIVTPWNRHLSLSSLCPSELRERYIWFRSLQLLDPCKCICMGQVAFHCKKGCDNGRWLLRATWSTQGKFRNLEFELQCFYLEACICTGRDSNEWQNPVDMQRTQEFSNCVHWNHKAPSGCYRSQNELFVQKQRCFTRICFLSSKHCPFWL